jgi:hypothetical protein
LAIPVEETQVSTHVWTYSTSDKPPKPKNMPQVVSALALHEMLGLHPCTEVHFQKQSKLEI